MKYWIARDTDGGLYLHEDKPEIDVKGYWWSKKNECELSPDLFPWVKAGECIELEAQ